MSLFTVNVTTCTRCGTCVNECPVGDIIELKPDSPVPSMKDGGADLCINCGHCVAVCPTGSFSLETMPVDACPTVQRDKLPSGPSVTHLLRSRRSVRHYQDKTVDQSIIVDLINTVSYTPTGQNMQELSWLVLYSREEVRRLSETTIQWMEYLHKEKHPAAVMFGVGRHIAAWRAGEDTICRNAPHVVVAHADKDVKIATIDGSAALTWFDIAAAASGLGTCWAGYVTACAAFWPPMREALNLPGNNALIGAMMFGYPKYEYHRIPLRKKPDVIWR